MGEADENEPLSHSLLRSSIDNVVKVSSDNGVISACITAYVIETDLNGPVSIEKPKSESDIGEVTINNYNDYCLDTRVDVQEVSISDSVSFCSEINVITTSGDNDVNCITVNVQETLESVPLPIEKSKDVSGIGNSINNTSGSQGFTHSPSPLADKSMAVP